jgi:PUA domain protein
MAEGKQHAMGIGYMKMSSEEIKRENKGEAIELLLYLNDGMWRLNME